MALQHREPEDSTRTQRRIRRGRLRHHTGQHLRRKRRGGSALQLLHGRAGSHDGRENRAGRGKRPREGRTSGGAADRAAQTIRQDNSRRSERHVRRAHRRWNAGKARPHLPADLHGPRDAQDSRRSRVALRRAAALLHELHGRQQKRRPRENLAHDDGQHAERHRRRAQTIQPRRSRTQLLARPRRRAAGHRRLQGRHGPSDNLQAQRRSADGAGRRHVQRRLRHPSTSRPSPTTFCPRWTWARPT